MVLQIKKQPAKAGSFLFKYINLFLVYKDFILAIIY
jgi:hypothetical protein